MNSVDLTRLAGNCAYQRGGQDGQSTLGMHVMGKVAQVRNCTAVPAQRWVNRDSSLP